MSGEDRLQANIRRTAGLHALRQMRALVDEENRQEAATANALRRLLRYGWIALLAIVLLLARLMGVY